MFLNFYVRTLYILDTRIMTSIFGTSGFFDSDKVQNQQAIANYTNFTGTLAVNGSPIYATGGPFLPLTGGTMSGSINLGGYALTSSVSKSIPCVRCTYSDSSFGFSATTTETSVIDGTLSGSLTIPAPTAAGFTMHMRAAWLYVSGAATTFAIRFKVNGTTILTTTIPAGAVVNQTIWAEHIIQLRSPNNRLFVSCRISRDAGATIINSTILDSIWNPASSNAITVTGQFSDTNGVWRGDSFSLDSSYAS